MKIYLSQAREVGANDSATIIGAFATSVGAQKAIKQHVKENELTGKYDDGGLSFTNREDDYDIWTTTMEVGD